MTDVTSPRLDDLRREYDKYQFAADCIDQFIDIMLNHRQSGHPGGSRSKVHQLVGITLTGAMRFDIRHPEKALGDRFVLIAGHCAPLVYGTLCFYHEAMTMRARWTGDKKYAIAGGEHRTLLTDDLLTLRRNKGLPGHVEMEGKTLFVKFNTGPSGHGAPAAAGEALALKLAGADQVKVWAFEGEGGHTAGAHHETKNSAYGLGLSNLVYMLDWNDWGIDENAVSSVVHGTPKDWFEPYGFRVVGTEKGSEWEGVIPTIHELAFGENPKKAPRAGWFKTTKGRGYLVTGHKSHGTPHKRNSEHFWSLRKVFSDKYGIPFPEFGAPDPTDSKVAKAQARAQLDVVLKVMEQHKAEIEFITDRLLQVGLSVPETLPGLKVNRDVSLLEDPEFTDVERLPKSLFAEPGQKVPNRKAFGDYGAYLNATALQKYGRPLVIAMAADLAESTNIAGFMKDFEGKKGTGWYQRDKNPSGALLPQQITEFTNAGICAGLATVNLARDPEHKFSGFLAACSTYGSFSYLKYGLMRLFSQLAQDCPLKVGKVIWVAGHSGPETAEDSRTHFGIFAPGVTTLFPQGWTINLHPWEHNDVVPALAAALRTNVPVIALHLTRPPVEVPDRAALGMDSHLMAARGAYILRDWKPGRRKEGTVIVLGTSVVSNIVKILPKLDRGGPNVKIVCAVSSELFARADQAWRDRVLPAREFMDSMVCANQGRALLRDWIPHRLAERYAMTPDWDNRWRTGGSLEEIVAEAHLDPDSLLAGIERFAAERSERLAELRSLIPAE